MLRFAPPTQGIQSGGKPPHSRSVRASHTTGPKQNRRLGQAQRAQHPERLNGEKRAPLLKLRYRIALCDAFADLGPAEQVRGVFVWFQRYLHELVPECRR